MTNWLSDETTLIGEAAMTTASALDKGEGVKGWRGDWTKLVDLGWPGVLVPVEQGGYGGSTLDLMLLSRALGAHLIKTPLLQDAALTTPLLCGALPARRATLLGRHLTGEYRIVLAYEETSRDAEGDYIATRVEVKEGGYVLCGDKRMVLYGADAHALIVAAMAPTAAGGEALGLFLVPRSMPGVTVTPFELIDGTEAANFSFDNVSLGKDAELLPSDADKREYLTASLLTGLLAAVGEAIGCLETALAQTIAHLNTRQQFGAPLASFQVLRHRVADMYIAIEELKSLGFAAARTDDKAEMLRAIRTAKIYLGRAGVWTAEQAVQLHGAMGVTEECLVGRVLKRITVLDRLFGGADHHICRLGSRLLNDASV